MKNRLKQLRKQKNLTQNDVAKLLGITNQAICLFEKGERTLKQENLQKLADFFDVSVPYLQGELTYDDLTLEEKDLEDDLVRRINDVINDEIRYSELSSEENRRAIKLALQSALGYYA